MNTSTPTIEESVSERGFTMVRRLAAPPEVVWQAGPTPTSCTGSPAYRHRPSGPARST